MVDNQVKCGTVNQWFSDQGLLGYKSVTSVFNYPRPLFATLAAVSVPKKKRKLKNLNKKEAGDVLDAFKEGVAPTSMRKQDPKVHPSPAESDKVCLMSIAAYGVLHVTQKPVLNTELLLKHAQNPTWQACPNLGGTQLPAIMGTFIGLWCPEGSR